ncbi:MAG: hypothetical protein GMKNLPBB_00207 [Myxococcota bacterium]|nr:hypothetical protein [Myxococcota bacterium]
MIHDWKGVKAGLWRQGELMPMAPGWLTGAERGYISQLVFPPRRDEWTAGRLALKKLLMEQRGVNPLDLSIMPTEAGPPMLVGEKIPADLHVSISHTGDWASATVSGAPAAVDLCLHADATRLSRIMLRFCTDAEIIRFDLKNRADLLPSLWALKEAALKAVNARMFDPGMKAFEIESLDPVRFLREDLDGACYLEKEVALAIVRRV